MSKILWTSYYAKSGKRLEAISISVKPPYWFPRMAPCPDLAPLVSHVKAVKGGTITQEEYTELYLQSLLNRGKTPQQVVDGLPEGAILLCYERSGTFCHRHVAAAWLKAGADVEINEIE